MVERRFRTDELPEMVPCGAHMGPPYFQMSWHVLTQFDMIWGFHPREQQELKDSPVVLPSIFYIHLSPCRPDSLIKSSVVKRYLRRCWGFAWSMRLGHPPSDCPVWIVWRCPFWTIQDFPDGRTQDILHSPTGCKTTKITKVAREKRDWYVRHPLWRILGY